MKSLAERDSEVIWHPFTQMKTAALPIAIVRGEGAVLTDENGKTYIDAISSWWTNLHGHAHPYMAEKISVQLNELEHVIFAGFTHLPAIELAERLLKILPGNLRRVFYSDNGSTAVEVAIKMTMQYRFNKHQSRPRILALQNAYHGDTFGAMSVSGRSAWTEAFSPFLFDVDVVPVPDGTGGGIQRVKALIAENKNQYNAFIFEPVIQGSAGMIIYDVKELDEMVRLCREDGQIIIADEVMTGFYRTGKMFATEYLENSADIICLSKGITGGTMALGVTACKDFIYEAFLSDEKSKTFFHGHSYTANPIACSAGLASLDLLEHEKCKQAIVQIHHHHQKFAEKLKTFPHLMDVKVCGTILSFEFRSSTGYRYEHALRDQLYDYYLSRGVLLRPLGNRVYLMPPYCITSEQLNEVYNVIEESVNKFTA